MDRGYPDKFEEAGLLAQVHHLLRLPREPGAFRAFPVAFCKRLTIYSDGIALDFHQLPFSFPVGKTNSKSYSLIKMLKNHLPSLFSILHKNINSFFKKEK